MHVVNAALLLFRLHTLTYLSWRTRSHTHAYMTADAYITLIWLWILISHLYDCRYWYPTKAFYTIQGRCSVLCVSFQIFKLSCINITMICSHIQIQMVKCTHIYTFAFIAKFVYVNLYIHANVNLGYIHTFTYVFIYLSAGIHLQIHIYAFIHILSLYSHTYAFIYIFARIFIHAIKVHTAFINK